MRTMPSTIQNSAEEPSWSLDETRQAKRQQEEQADREHHRDDHRPDPDAGTDFLCVLIRLALGQLCVGGDAKRLEADRERTAERNDPAQDRQTQPAMARQRRGER